jgi:two-component system chemotaxis response regulator CheB
MKKKTAATSEEKCGDISPVFIGASAGGSSAIIELISQFEQEMQISVFIVLHLSHASIGDFLVYKLQPYTPFLCKLAEDGETVKGQTIYIAPPNKHLLVKKNKVVLGYGPLENRWKPSIDVLFRSAAAAYGACATGIILTGLLDDGTSGMAAIKKSGGTCIVQDPNEAEFPDMPLSVLNHIEVDYTIPLSEMGTVLQKISARKHVKQHPIPEEVKTEARISEKVAIGVTELSKVAEQSVFSCPDCGGGLWEVKDESLHRYRCHIGHAYSQKDLIVKQSESIEETLWVALRMMEERRNLMTKIIDQNTNKGLKQTASVYKKKIADIEVHIARMREILFSVQQD